MKKRLFSKKKNKREFSYFKTPLCEVFIKSLDSIILAHFTLTFFFFFFFCCCY